MGAQTPPAPGRGLIHTSWVWPCLDDAALRLGEETVTYGEILLVGAHTGLLRAAGANTMRALRALESGLVSPRREDVRAEAVRFRQERRLQSGEDLRAWLASRGLTRLEWEGYLGRLLAGRSPLEPPEAPIAAGAFESALVTDLACSGWWKTVADETERYWSAGRLAEVQPDPADSEDDAALRRAAEELAASLPPCWTLEAQWCATRLRVLRWRERALEAAERRYGSDEVVAARIADHAADWLHFVFDEISLPSRAAASEAILCCREEGVTPEEISRRSRRALERRDLRQDGVPVGTAALLSGAVPGEPLGPLEQGGVVQVLWLQERRPPSLADPAVRQAAAWELLAEALERAAGGRAQQVGPL